MQIETLNIKNVFHVGTLDIKNRSSYSAEGEGLSVSVTPHEWCKIARGHLGSQFYSVHNENASFALFDEQHIPMLIDWAISKKYITSSEIVVYPYYDDEYETHCEDAFSSFESAQNEVDESEWDCLKAKTIYKPTDYFRALFKTIDVKNDPFHEIFAQYLIEYRPDVCGIWFNSILDPMRLTAPAGLIFDHKVKHWNITAIEESDAPIIEEVSDLPNILQAITILK